MAPESPGKSDADAFAEAYRQHAATLRNWYVAYGIGGPVLFLGNEKLAQKLVAAGEFGRVGVLFLLGVALQVALAMCDKYADWICYYQAAKPSALRSPLSPLAEWWVEANWPSLLLDAGSFILFAAATVLAFRAVV